MTVIYPNSTKHETESQSIFFIGNASEYCSINGKELSLIHEGNFCPVYELELGENIFKVELDNTVYDYSVFRKEAQVKEEYQFKAYDGHEPSKSIKKICVDPGHGGSQAGTCSPKGVLEKDLNLDLSILIAEALDKAGLEVMLTRDGDWDLALSERVAMAEKNQADLLLSIHHNAISDHLDPIEHEGISAHYYYEHSLDLAKAMSAHLAQALNMKNNSAIQQNLYLTRENKFSRSILLECGYLIHPIESEKLVSKQYQADFAKSLADFLAKNP